ncbi:YwiC-like family protein [Poriferisphaera sp. WC338]|uniref:YwiC-like family protein n=1 Tax=Poriferisphaera sp. WC338 TaxID=3425129 RepID=UPI003D8140DC
MNEHEPKSEQPNKTKAKLRSVLLPAEHGVWASLIEVITMGLIVGASWQSAYVGLMAILMGLCLQPFKLVVRGAPNKYQVPRIKIAQKALTLLAPLTVGIILLGSFSSWMQPSFILPLMIAVPLVIVQWYYDAIGKPRALPGVFSGMLAIATIAPAMLLATRTEYRFAIAIYLVLAARQLSSIMYTRYVIRTMKKLPATIWGVIGMHKGCALLIVLIYVVFPEIGSLIWILVGSYLLLCIRAAIVIRLIHQGQTFKAKQIGMSELLIGLIYIILTGSVLASVTF